MDSGKRPRQPNDGFTTGLQFWLFFLIGLVLLGYPLAIAIVFGAIAGLAGGFIATNWQQILRLNNQEINDADLLASRTPDDLLETVRTKRTSRYEAGRKRRSMEERRNRLNWVPWRQSRE